MFMIDCECADDGVRAFSSYLFEGLVQPKKRDRYDYSGVETWAQAAKINFFELTRALIPINIGDTHWALIVVHVVEKRVVYHDSIARGRPGRYYLRCALMLLRDEAARLGVQFDRGEWTLVRGDPATTPQQENGA
jgi:Ulp1 family protease